MFLIAYTSSPYCEWCFCPVSWLARSATQRKANLTKGRDGSRRTQVNKGCAYSLVVWPGKSFYKVNEIVVLKLRWGLAGSLSMRTIKIAPVGTPKKIIEGEGICLAPWRMENRFGKRKVFQRICILRREAKYARGPLIVNGVLGYLARFFLRLE